MVENTNIEWATHTFSPWVGCQKVGPGCDHCYAEVWDGNAQGESRWGPHATRTRSKQGNWDRVVTWNSKARDAGTRESVFVASLSDVFDTHKTIDPAWRADLAALVMKCTSLDFMFLTKRAGNVAKLLGEMFPGGTPSNLWIGITVVNQEEANRDIPKLLEAKAECSIRAVFLSMEPLLGPVDLEALCFADEDAEIRMNALTAEAWVDNSESAAAYSDEADGLQRVDWVIVGGETGDGARPMHIDWVRDLRDQCERSGTPFLFKQWGVWFPCGEIDATGHANSPAEEDAVERYAWDSGSVSVRLDKKVAGRQLDGRAWDGLPQPG